MAESRHPSPPAPGGPAAVVDGAAEHPAAHPAEHSGAAPVPAAPEQHAADDGVASARAELAQVSDRPLAEHPDVFERVHGRLNRVLAEIDDA